MTSYRLIPDEKNWGVFWGNEKIGLVFHVNSKWRCKTPRGIRSEFFADKETSADFLYRLHRGYTP